MDGRSLVWPLVLIAGGLLGPLGRAACAQPTAEGEAFAARLVRPDLQAAEVLRLFEGTRWRDPAAALAAWKLSRSDTGLGKAAEAVIALFNAEMAREWRSLDGAEIRIRPDRETGDLGWCVVVPHDDGTVAAGITAMRLTYPDDRPIVLDGKDVHVARLGKSGVALACQAGPAVVVASSREALERGLAIATAGVHSTPAVPGPAGGTPWNEVMRRGGMTGDHGSGTFCRLEPARLATPRGSPLLQRRMIEALRASGYGAVEGGAAMRDGSLRLDVSGTFEGRAGANEGAGPRAVDRAWLEALPTDGAMAAVSLAIDRDPASWDMAFAVADRVERVDPARAGVAPLRSRLNLLALGAGVKLEADLRPHLLGLSACLYGEPTRPVRVAGALVVLHLDEAAVARRLVEQARPRLGSIGGSDGKPRAVTLRSRGRDIWIAWGEAAIAASREDRPAPTCSLAGLCCGWEGEGSLPPARVGAFWPARIWRPAGMSEAAVRALADGPPVVWWGCSQPGRTRDLLRWSGLGERVRRFLDSIPVEPGPTQARQGPKVPESEPRIRHQN